MTSLIENYLKGLHEGLFSSDAEKPEIKQIRETKKYIWLYHSSPPKNYKDIKENGLDPNHQGETHGSPMEHPSGKKALSYSSSKIYSMFWSGSLNDSEPLLVKVPTDELFFGTRVAKKDWDEYQSPKIIRAKDVVFPDSLRYKKIESESSYLNITAKL